MVHNCTSLSQLDPELTINDVIRPDARELLEIYSGISPTDVNLHVARIVSAWAGLNLHINYADVVSDPQAKQSWEIAPYPCFRLAIFLQFALSQSPAYTRIIDRVKQGALFIDLGCGLGQDIRRLAYDGAPSENLVGLDLRNAVIELGYELFRDRDKLRARFISQNFFQNAPELGEIMGKAEIINSSLFMHLWDRAGQVRIGRRMIELLTPQGGLITGWHSGVETLVITKLKAGSRGLFIMRCPSARCGQKSRN